MCNKMPVTSVSVLEDNIQKCECEGHHEYSHDHFKMTHPDTELESCLKHAEEIGLGTIEYELKKFNCLCKMFCIYVSVVI